MNKFINLWILLLVCGIFDVQAMTAIQIMKTNTTDSQPSDTEIANSVAALIDVEKYRQVKVQLIRDEQGKPDHYLVYLHSKTSHRVDFAKIPLDANMKALAVEYGYQLQQNDFKQQPGFEATHSEKPVLNHDTESVIKK